MIVGKTRNGLDVPFIRDVEFIHRLNNGTLLLLRYASPLCFLRMSDLSRPPLPLRLSLRLSHFLHKRCCPTIRCTLLVVEGVLFCCRRYALLGSYSRHGVVSHGRGYPLFCKWDRAPRKGVSSVCEIGIEGTAVRGLVS